MALAANPTFKVTPTSTKTILPTNYISLFDYSHQYDVATHDKLAPIYGSQSITGMLPMMSAESSFDSDLYKWTEEGRLHTVYTDATRTGAVFTKVGHVFRKGETVHINDASIKLRGVIIAVTADTFTVAPFKAAGFGALATSALTVFVDGSEHKKGTPGVEGSLETDLTILENSPVILKDKYEVSGSDIAQVTWVKTQEGYVWALKSENDTRRRWEDRLETSMINGEVAESGSDAETNGYKGTEGMFEALRVRGNVYDGIASTIGDVDSIVKRFDAQGKIADYMFYVDRDQDLAIDDMLGALNAGYSTGVSYGLFDNDEEMAVNLGFRGFKRAGYNIFKTSYKLLNDPTMLGAVPVGAGKVRGVLIPMGTTEVYEGEYRGMSKGKKTYVPYAEVKYRANEFENRKHKTWVTGSVGNAVPTDDSDTMQRHHLSERMFCAVGANNYMLFEGA